MTTDQFKQQLEELGHSPAEAENLILNLKAELSDACTVGNKSHLTRQRIIGGDAVFSIIIRLLFFKKEGLQSPAKRRAERRKLKKGGYLKNKEDNKEHFVRPLVLPVGRGTDARSDLKSELMYYFLYWDELRPKKAQRMRRKLDPTDQLMSWESAAKTVARIIFIFDIEKPRTTVAKSKLKRELMDDNKIRKENGKKVRSEPEILKMIESGSEDGSLHDIAVELMAKKIFDAYKEWNSTQISGLPKGVYLSLTGKGLMTVLRQDGKREFQYSTDKAVIKKSKIPTSFR